VQGSVTTAPPPTTDPGPDVTVPTPPPSVSVSASVYTVPGSHKVSAAVSWTPVSENQDGSPYTDHDHYLVSSSRDAGLTWSPESPVIETYMWISDLEPGSSLRVRIRTKDHSGNVSDVVEYTVPVLPVDETPPPAPSMPVTTSRLGTTMISWDGRAHDGSLMPDDFLKVEVMTEGAEQTVWDDPLHSGPWAARGASAWPFNSGNGVMFQFAGLGAPLGTVNGEFLVDPFSDGEFAVALRYPSEDTYQVVVTSVGGDHVFDLTTIVPAGTPVNVAVTLGSGKAVLRVNGEDQLEVPLPADSTYFSTDPATAGALTMESDLWISTFVYFPPGHPEWIGTLGMPNSPQSITFNDQEYQRAYNVWFVAVDRSGNRSEAGEVASFVSTPLVAQDLVGRIITGAHIVRGSVNAAETIIGGTITGDLIQANTINADHIEANSIRADHIDAGAIDGQVITGAIIRTSDSDWRMEMDASGLRGYGGLPEGSMTLTQFGIDAAFGEFSTLDVGHLTVDALTLQGPLQGEKTAEFSAESLFSLRSKWAHAPETYGLDAESTAPTNGQGATRLHLRNQGVAAASTMTASIESLSQYNNAGADGLLALVAPRGLGSTANRQGAILLDGSDVFVDAHHYSGNTMVQHPRRSLYLGSEWIPLDLIGNWQNYSSATTGYSAAAYKIIGSIVILRGLIRNTGTPASGDNIVLLGPGLVPPNGSGANIFSAPGNGGEGEVQLNPMDYVTAANRGYLSYRKGLSGTSNWLSLANVWWPLF